jgi:hypothetical protein
MYKARVQVEAFNRAFAYWSTKGILIRMFIKRMVRRALAVFDKQVKPIRGSVELLKVQ